MTDISKAVTFTFGTRTVKRVGYGAMRLAENIGTEGSLFWPDVRKVLETRQLRSSNNPTNVGWAKPTSFLEVGLRLKIGLLPICSYRNKGKKAAANERCGLV